jgi:hypothetical protein
MHAMQVKTHHIDHSLSFEVEGDRYAACPSPTVKIMLLHMFSANLLQIFSVNHDSKSRSILTVIDNAAGHDIPAPG